MSNPPSPLVLFTTRLSEKKIAQLEKAGLQYRQESFISFTFPSGEDWASQVPANCDAWIFTSKKAVKALRENFDRFVVPEYIFAVGSKTAGKLAELSLDAITPKEFNAASLAQLITEYDLDRLVHFRGNLGSDEIKNLISRQGAELIEVKVYRTELTPVSINESEIEGIVFMSPSAVESYFEINAISDGMPVFCIGPSTAGKAVEYGISKAIQPNKSTFESLIQSIIQYFKNDL